MRGDVARSGKVVEEPNRFNDQLERSRQWTLNLRQIRSEIRGGLWHFGLR
jgi:hypothetical protein